MGGRRQRAQETRKVAEATTPPTPCRSRLLAAIWGPAGDAVAWGWAEPASPDPHPPIEPGPGGVARAGAPRPFSLPPTSMLRINQ